MPSNNDSFLRDGELPDDFLDEIDKELESFSTPVESIDIQDFAPAETVDIGLQQMQETFVAISRVTLGPIDRYMKALALNENLQDVLEITELIVTPMIPRTEQVGLTEHADDLIFFRSLLVLALGERDPVGMDAMREVVMEGFSKMSDRFGLSYRGYRIAVRNLIQFYRGLKNADGVHESEIRKFFAIGVPSLTWIRKTKPDELANLSGVPVDVVREIRKLAFTYRSISTPVAAAQLVKEEYPPKPFYEIREEDHFDIEAVEVVDADVLTDIEIKASPRGRA